MSTSATESSGPSARSVSFVDDRLVVELRDGRSISAPLAWYPRLAFATAAERDNWQIFGGTGIHWPDLDEDISVPALLSGKPSNESPESIQRWLAGRNGARG